MSLEIVSEKTTKDSSGYAQEQTDSGTSNSRSGKTSSQTQTARNERNLQSTSTSAKTSANKVHIAFNLSFAVKLSNLTPLPPNC